MMARRFKAWLLNPVVAAGLWIGLVGAFMNNKVILANGGMPVCGRVVQDGIHIPMTDQTKLNWIADWIHVSGQVMSPGDALIYLAMLVGSIGVFWGFLYANDRRRIA